MQAFFAVIYVLLVPVILLGSIQLKADWQDDLKDAIKYHQTDKALSFINQYKKAISSARLVNNTSKRTLLHEAASAGLTDVVNELISAGANIEAQDDLESTPLDSALSGNHIDTARAILDHARARNIDLVNRRESTRGYTPLHRAVIGLEGDAIRLLIDYGADRTIRGRNQDRPIDIAYAYERDTEFPDVQMLARPIVQLLEAYQPGHIQVHRPVQSVPQGRVNLVQEAQRHFQAAQQQQANTGVLARLANWWHGGGSN